MTILDGSLFQRMLIDMYLVEKEAEGNSAYPPVMLLNTLLLYCCRKIRGGAGYVRDCLQ
jgi:hypothetical protein